MRQMLILIAVFAAIVPACSQNTPSDSQTLRDILAELRELRRELQTTTVAAERVQIALYRLQLQDAVVARASKTADDIHSKLVGTTRERQSVAGLIEQREHALESGTRPEHELRSMRESLPRLKTSLEQLTRDEAQGQSKAAEADAQLAREQTKLEDLHNILDQLDEALQIVGRAAESKPRH